MREGIDAVTQLRSAALRALFLLTLSVVGGCSTPPLVAAPAATAVATRPTPAATTEVPSARTVTQADDGQTSALHVGESFLLKLGSEYDWTVTVGDQSILSRVVNVLVAKDAQGLYEANQAGQTELMAVGDPLCRQAKPACGRPSIQFKVDLIVQSP